MAEAGIEPIDLVVVNLYPFEEWAARPAARRDEVVEHIDIGGPAMIRAAAKNHARVAVLTSPDQYGAALEELRAGGGELSARLAAAWPAEAYPRTARYDAAIAEWMAAGEGDFPDALLLDFERRLDLSYGENPHQRAAYYAERGRAATCCPASSKLHGKDLSFNNLLDLDAARGLLAASSSCRPA